MKQLAPILTLLFLFSCNQQSDTTKYIEDPDYGFKVFNTHNVAEGTSRKKLSFKNLEKTQYDFIQRLNKDYQQDFIIKLSDSTVLVLNNEGKLLERYKVFKKWVDPIGPNDEYKLSDSKGNEYLLSHMIDIEKINYLNFRWNKSLKSYNDKNPF